MGRAVLKDLNVTDSRVETPLWREVLSETFAGFHGHHLASVRFPDHLELPQ